MEQTNNHWPEHGLESVPNCPVCGSSQRKLLYRDLTDRVFFCAPGKWSLFKCQDCRCAFLDPRPSADTIQLAYSKYYTHTPPKREDLQTFGPLRRLRRSMGNGYMNWRFGTDLQPANSLGIPVALIIPSLRQRLEQGFRNLSRPKPGARLLDVGFGSGAFLRLAHNIGWKVAGVDPDPVSVDAAIKRGLDVRHGGIEAYADMPGSFDVITLSHVIEHVHNPLETLQTIFRLLKPGGFLWLSTPNIHSLGHEYYGNNWRGLEPPRHLVLFNWYAICEALKNKGFTSIQKNRSNLQFASIAAKSEAISKGVDPYTATKVSFRHRLTAILAGIRIRVEPHRTEYIKLIAYKP